MKNSFKNYLGFIALFGLLFICSATFATIDRSRNISKSYQLKNDTEIRISNQFGKVHIDVWESRELKVDIAISVEAKSEKLADNILDAIDIKMNEKISNGTIDIETQIDEHNNKGSFTIDYLVHMPSKNPLRVENKFGDVYLEALQNSAKISVKFGQLKTGHIDGDVTINLGFGNGVSEVASIKTGNIVLEHSKLEIGAAQRVNIESKFSNLLLGQMNAISLNGKHGEINVTSAAQVNADLAFTGLKIDQISKSLNIKSKHGKNLKIGKISKDFESILIDSEFSSSELNFEQGASADLHITLKFGNLKTADDRITFTSVTKETNSTEFEGYVGRQNSGSEIKINGKYGDVKLRFLD